MVSFPPHRRLSDFESSPNSSFANQFAAIIGRELDARTVSSYADEALDNLISMVESILLTYSDNTMANTPKAERERYALVQAGLDPNTIEVTLDHIARIADSTKLIDELIIQKTERNNTVLVPPDHHEMNIQPGNGSFESSKEIIPKLKTLLLLLKEEFAIDLESDDVRIATGTLDTTMMRGQSYNLVEIESLNRFVLVCDEMGNTTFVFDTEKCVQTGFTPKEVGNLSKSQLKELLLLMPELGKKIDYSQEYVNHLANALIEQVPPNENPEQTLQEIRLLSPKVETIAEGYMSRKSLSDSLGLSFDTVQRAIDNLGSQLGVIVQAKVNHQTTNVYSPDQQRMIRDWLDAQGLFLGDIPEGYFSVKSLARSLGIGEQTAKRAISALGSQLGETLQARVRGRAGTAYSSAQKDMIEYYLSDNGLVAEEPPEGYLSLSGVAASLGTTTYTVNSAIENLGDEIGETIQSRMGVKITIAYSPDQQAIIKNYLDKQGTLVPVAPEGYLSAKGIAESLGVVRQTVQRAIDSLDSQLGETLRFRFGNKIATAYSPDQQGMIRDWLQDHSKARFD